jgi:hypothetical protein
MPLKKLILRRRVPGIEVFGNHDRVKIEKLASPVACVVERLRREGKTGLGRRILQGKFVYT